MSDMSSRKKPSYVTIKIPKELTDKVDRLVGKEGFTSRGEVAKVALRKLLDNYKDIISVPVLVHFNLDEDGVKIRDLSLTTSNSPHGLIVDIAFKPKGIWCGYCETNDCRHIQFALSVPAIQKVIRKRIRDGWNLPEP